MLLPSFLPSFERERRNASYSGHGIITMQSHRQAVFDRMLTKQTSHTPTSNKSLENVNARTKRLMGQTYLSLSVSLSTRALNKDNSAAEMFDLVACGETKKKKNEITAVVDLSLGCTYDGRWQSTRWF